MDNQYRERLSKHLSNQAKYLKLIFNDQAILAVMVLIGGLSFAYYNFLRTVVMDRFTSSAIISLILASYLMLGKLPTLLKKADELFLLPKNKQFFNYFKSSVEYSLLLPYLGLIFLYAALVPFILVTTKLVLINIIGLSLGLLLAKLCQQIIRMTNLYRFNQNQSPKILFFIFLLNLITIFASIYLQNTLIIILFWGVFIINIIWDINKNNLQDKPINWLYAVNEESRRMYRIYQIYNLFVKVPTIPTKIARKSYLDFIVNHANHVFSYLFQHALIRVQQIFRPIILQVLILLWLTVVIGETDLYILIEVAILYMIFLQMLPIYNRYEENVMTLLYPVDNMQKINDFKKLVIEVLGSIIVLVNLVNLIVHRANNWQLIGIGLFITLIELGFLTKIYLSSKSNKLRRI